MKVRLHDAAFDELNDAALYYSQVDFADLDAAFLNEFTRIRNMIECSPTAGHPFAKDISRTIRRCLMTQFPYNVIFMRSIDHAASQEPQEEVIVLAVMHQSRRPNYWADRLQTSVNH